MVYTPEEFAEVAGEIKKQPPTRADARRLARLTFSGAYELEMDRHGRVLVPPPLRQYAGLERDVVIVGTGRFLEIWSREAWDGERASLDEDAPEIAERAAETIGDREAGRGSWWACSFTTRLSWCRRRWTRCASSPEAGT